MKRKSASIARNPLSAATKPSCPTFSGRSTVNSASARWVGRCCDASVRSAGSFRTPKTRIAARTKRARLITLCRRNERGRERVDRDVKKSERHRFDKNRHWNGDAGHDVIDQIERLQVGKNQRDEREKSAGNPAGVWLLQPIFARGRLQMSDEINEDHHHDRENVRGRKCRNEKRQRREQACFQE